LKEAVLHNTNKLAHKNISVDAYFGPETRKIKKRIPCDFCVNGQSGGERRYLVLLVKKCPVQ
jgi:hypothetical protein